ncbi:TniQ family protein [Pseudoalteromonas sp. SSMSWG5]|uniref:TniQ family protein n=1 Tax=Pseudoalteromonas sp. SSMSWG5 TaxID=3139396 RepID=UPI003BAC46D0
MARAESLLGVRPYRLPSESLAGYLLRLAYLNGFTGLSNFLWTIGMRPLKSLRMNHFTPTEIAHLEGPLSQVLGRNAANDMEREYIIPWEFDDNRVFKHALVDFPRICPHCIAEQESPALDWRWQCAFIPLCPTHNTPLINQCPYCEHLFDWNADLFECCPACKAPWRNIELEKVDLLCEITPLIWPSDDGTIALKRTQLHDVMLALMSAGRPKDMLQHNLTAVPKTPHHWCYALRALKLLFDVNYFDSWKTMADNAWEPAQLAPSDLFVRQLRYDNWPILNEEGDEDGSEVSYEPSYECDLLVSNESLETAAYIKSSRAKAAAKQKQEQWYTHLSHALLASFLGVKSETLTPLTDVQLLPQLNSTSMLRDKLFDAHEITHFLNARFTQSIREPILINENHRSFRRYLTSYGDLLAAWLRGEVCVNQVSVGDLSSVHIDKDEFAKFLIAQFNLACKDSIGITRVARCLGIPSPKVEEYVTQGHFHYAAWRFDRAIDGPSFGAYYTPPLLEDLL